MVLRLRKPRPKREAQDAWFVRWTLQGCPSLLPLDMFCAIPGTVFAKRQKPIFGLLDAKQHPNRLPIILREGNKFTLSAPLAWPEIPELSEYLRRWSCDEHLREYQFGTLERLHWGTRRLILAAQQAGLL